MKHNQGPVVAIVGASFAGLSALLMLRKRLGNNVIIKLFDSRTHFTHIPGLHDAILEDTKVLENMQIDLARTYREFIHCTVSRIESHQLHTSDNQIHHFDYCIIATGSRTKFPLDEDSRRHAYTLNYASDVITLNHKLHAAETHNITIIGGGYTGIEIASIIAQRKRKDQHVTIINSKPIFLGDMEQSISTKIQQWFDRHHVTILSNTKVQQIQSDHLILTNGTRVKSDCHIVARGIKVNDETFASYLTFDDAYQPKDLDHIYLCGDVAQHGLIATAHNAMFEGRRMGNLIADQILDTSHTYPPLANRDKLAIALGANDGIFTLGKRGYYIPWLMGIIKKVIQYRVIIEFQRRIMFPL